MATSIATQAAALLVTRTIGVTVEANATDDLWTIKVGRLVDKPDRLICLMDTPSLNPHPTNLLDFSRFQVIVRGPKDDYQAAYQKIKDIKDSILGQEPYDNADGRWDGVIGQGDINFLSYDDNDRPMFSASYQVFFEPVASATTNRVSL